MTSLADADLIRRYVEQRAEDAFAELVRRHIDLVYRAAWRKVGDAHLAEDVTQAVFTALAWKAPTLVRHQTITGWLHTSTRFAANELLRRERRRRTREQEAVRMNETSSHATDRAWEELRPVIDDALGELNERDREAVLLRFFSGRSLAAVGAALDIPENTARMRVERALDKLHGLLARRGITSTTAALGVALANQAVGAAMPATLAASVTSAALTSATAGGSVIATTTFVANLTKVQAVVTAAAALVLGLAVYQNFAGRRLKAQAVTAKTAAEYETRRIAFLERDLNAAQAERLRQPEKSATAPERKAPNGLAATASPAAPSQLEAIRDRYLERRAVRLSNPDYQRLENDLRRLEGARQYAQLFRQLKLVPERVQQFETLLVEYDRMIDDIQAAAITQRVDLSGPAIDRLQAAEREKFADRMRTLLGPADFAVYEHFKQTSDLRFKFTEPVALALYSTDMPLTAAQAEILTEILARHAKAGKDGNKDTTTLDWEAALPATGHMLTPVQREALQGARAQHVWSETLADALSPLVNTPSPAKPGGG